MLNIFLRTFMNTAGKYHWIMRRKRSAHFHWLGWIRILINLNYWVGGMIGVRHFTEVAIIDSVILDIQAIFDKTPDSKILPISLVNTIARACLRLFPLLDPTSVSTLHSKRLLEGSRGSSSRPFGVRLRRESTITECRWIQLCWLDIDWFFAQLLAVLYFAFLPQLLPAEYL